MRKNGGQYKLGVSPEYLNRSSAGGAAPGKGNSGGAAGCRSGCARTAPASIDRRFPESNIVGHMFIQKTMKAMLAPRIPRNEAERIQVLHELLILDTEPEERFDLITTYCQSRFGVEIALVSLVDTDRQWFKSTCGLDAKETPREISFCGHAILQDDVLIVRNALEDPRFASNPLVLGPPRIRFYAGAPLKLSSGLVVGTLCIIDSQPKRLEEEEVDHLRVLAHMVAMELEGLGRLSDCRKNCLYGHLPATCPYVHTRHELPG